ncbi:MAG: 4Fe-4S dicluster domain-containing protein [Telmatospirillum sp.]|nr:4Fe-4S dicluster domain-containing protein [Telmatospirillum sp.]
MIDFIKIKLFELFHVFFRHFNFPCELGLRVIGRPDAGSPVFLSGNYALTVHRLMKRLRPFDCYLIVANSKGSNVWCAAGMNEFNEFDIIDAINVSGIGNIVRGRRIIAPPYAAPGVDTAEVARQTGFRLVWGPTHLDDLPDYIRHNYRRTYAMTQARFGFVDRLEQALSTSLVYCMTIFPLAFFYPAYTARVMGLIFLLHISWFSLWDVLPTERLWAKTLSHLLLAQAGLVAVAGAEDMAGDSYALWAATISAIVLLISLDGCGSSTLYKTTPRHWLTKGDYRCHFQPIVDPDKCTSCYDCIHVCPKGVLARLPKGPAVAVRPDNCIECLACVKSCETDAFFNRSRDWKGDVKSIANLGDIMTRDWRHLDRETRWIGAPLKFQGEMLVVDLAAMTVAETAAPGRSAAFEPATSVEET